jgi:hypothetical protein
MDARNILVKHMVFSILCCHTICTSDHVLNKIEVLRLDSSVIGLSKVFGQVALFGLEHGIQQVL